MFSPWVSPPFRIEQHAIGRASGPHRRNDPDDHERAPIPGWSEVARSYPRFWPPGAGIQTVVLTTTPPSWTRAVSAAGIGVVEDLAGIARVGQLDGVVGRFTGSRRLLRTGDENPPDLPKARAG